MAESRKEKRVYLNQHVLGPDKCGMGMLTAALETSTHTSQCLKIDSGAFSRYRAVVRMMKEAEFWAARTDWEYIDSNGFPGHCRRAMERNGRCMDNKTDENKQVQFNHSETAPWEGKTYRPASHSLPRRKTIPTWTR